MNEVIQGDCLEVMRGMADCSVDAVVTDPPYGLSFMGRTWDYDVPKVEVWREVLRVLKPGGHVLSFAGSRTHHRMAVNIEDAGFDLRDTLMWVYGSGFPKSHNLDGEWDGWGSALKPAFEPITLARKPLQGTIAQNVQEWGTGGLNIDGCRVETDEVGRPREKDVERMSHPDWRMTGGSTGSGASNSAGRWPANVIHDGSEEVVGCFPETVSGASGEGCSTKVGGIFGSGNKVTSPYRPPSSGSAARFFQQCPDTDPEDAETRRLFYCGKATKRDRDEGLEGFEEGAYTLKNDCPEHIKKEIEAWLTSRF